jgi:hypothetical protein
LEVLKMTRHAVGDRVKELPSHSIPAKRGSIVDLESFKLQAKNSIDLLMSVDSDMNPFRDKPTFDEIMADIRRASSIEELQKTINGCLDAVKNVVATYIELNRVIEEMQGELMWKSRCTP